MTSRWGWKKDRTPGTLRKTSVPVENISDEAKVLSRRWFTAAESVFGSRFSKIYTSKIMEKLSSSACFLQAIVNQFSLRWKAANWESSVKNNHWTLERSQLWEKKKNGCFHVLFELFWSIFQSAEIVFAPENTSPFFRPKHINFREKTGKGAICLLAEKSCRCPKISPAILAVESTFELWFGFCFAFFEETDELKNRFSSQAECPFKLRKILRTSAEKIWGGKSEHLSPWSDARKAGDEFSGKISQRPEQKFFCQAKDIWKKGKRDEIQVGWMNSNRLTAWWNALKNAEIPRWTEES